MQKVEFEINEEGVLTACILNGETEVTIPSNVTSIGDRVFENFKSLTQVNIPNSVTSIGKTAFYGCYRLTKINIPNSVKSIGDCAFSYCDGLTQVHLPNGMNVINTLLFNNCPNLTKINIPEGVKEIAKMGLAGCYGVTSLEIPDSMISIDKQAFFQSWMLTEIRIPALLEFNSDLPENCMITRKPLSFLANIGKKKMISNIERAEVRYMGYVSLAIRSFCAEEKVHTSFPLEMLMLILSFARKDFTKEQSGRFGDPNLAINSEAIAAHKDYIDVWLSKKYREKQKNHSCLIS